MEHPIAHALERLVVRHTLRVPAPEGKALERNAPEGSAWQGADAVRQFDVALMSVGFKLSGGLMAALGGLDRPAVETIAARALATVRELVGDHVGHNVYFKDFPAGVPDTLDFWAACVAQALAADEETRTRVLDQLRHGHLDLLSLPTYGRYQHTYEDMLAAHDELTASARDRVTVLGLGGPLEDEVTDLYRALAGSTTPLGPEHLADLAVLATHCADGPQPDTIPIRESRAVVNKARLMAGCAPLLDTVTDVLRLACALADGDVTLRERTRFRALSRPYRRALLAGLDTVLAAAPGKYADVAPYREQWKRLGERLHPHEYPQWPHAAEVFAIARGERKVPSLAAGVEELLGRDEVAEAAGLLAREAPGLLLRSLDRLLRTAAGDGEREAVLAAVERAVPGGSGRVLLSVREHLQNRAEQAASQRVFVNRAGGAWVADDTRAPIPSAVRERVLAVLDAEIRRRLDAPAHLLVDPDILDVALPLSGRAAAAGLGTLPRGSLSPVDGELLRFFTYWKEAARTTDYDLSALVLRDDYATGTWLSYTNLRSVAGTHSGDVTEAPDGASEFIDLWLGAVDGRFIVPHVNIYSGEGFDEVAESFFGFMLRDAAQGGRPYEPRTVRMKSDLRGPGRIALPLVFERDDEGGWQARWLHLYLKGSPAANTAERNRVSFAILVRGLVERTPLTLRYLLDLMAGKGARITVADGRTVPDEPVVYLGLEPLDGLAPGSRVITPGNLRDLIPA
ncbi:hypothetical protein AB0C52_19870 [Streptomyces sp. NPDC048717]|uniref:hypothetical protein n=1 Tax=Streptomyces sp. NPDC048717 TaxID=3154928 RepID=UPI0034181A37